MLFPLFLAGLAGVAPHCADPDTAAGMRAIDNGVPSCDRPRVAPAQRAITPGERRKMLAAFDKILRDGPTTRWRVENVRGNFLVCGYLNSKNAFGAYVGWKPFTYDIQSDSASTYDEDRTWLFETLCHGAPVPRD